MGLSAAQRERLADVSREAMIHARLHELRVATTKITLTAWTIHAIGVNGSP
jgi:hypothetical protein